MKTPEIISKAQNPHFILVELLSRSNTISFRFNGSMFKDIKLTKLCTGEDSTPLSVIEQLKDVELVNYSERDYNMPEFNQKLQTIIDEILADSENNEFIGFTKKILIGYGFQLTVKTLPVSRRHRDYYMPKVAETLKGIEINFKKDLAIYTEQTTSTKLMNSEYNGSSRNWRYVRPNERAIDFLFNEIVYRTEVLIKDGRVLNQDEKCETVLNTLLNVVSQLNQRENELVNEEDRFTIHTEYFYLEVKLPKVS